MSKILLVIGVMALFPFSASFAEESGFVPLFDGKTLNGWTAAKNSGDGDWGDFSVNEAEKAIHVYAGKTEGTEQTSNCLNTVKAFSNYILKLEYKWAGKRFAPRTDWDRDSGLLFHVHGDLKNVWPHSLEMQIGESSGEKENTGRRFHTGDLFVLGPHLRVEVPQSNNFYDPAGKPQKGGHVLTKLGVERPMGEWNEIEIRVEGGKQATYVMNGEVVLQLFNMEQKKGDAYEPLEKGHIGLQAEWAEILYRNIRIKELPAK